MKIAQVAPLYESVPPKAYGGTERVVSYLTEELVRQGHDVTLYASGDSITRARLVPGCARSLRSDDGCIDQLAHHFTMLERVVQEAAHHDIVHFHVDYLHFPLSRRMETPSVTTLHGRLDLPDLVPLYEEFCDRPLVSISDAQRAPLDRAGWRGTIHHGLPKDLHRLGGGDGGYLAFVGRVSPEKGLDRAIEIARRSRHRLRIAAKIDRADRQYHERQIVPLLRQRHVEFVGEIGDDEKQDFLGQAKALLFPIDWPEPFGLVMIEALAVGTPVIAFRRGSTPEVLEDGVTGFVVDDIGAAVRAVERVGELDRRRCREEFERRFSAPRMARDYIGVYRALLPAAKAAEWSEA
jgi:glycosyltransferase involved in cell wall biosynthesis